MVKIPPPPTKYQAKHALVTQRPNGGPLVPVIQTKGVAPPQTRFPASTTATVQTKPAKPGPPPTRFPAPMNSAKSTLSGPPQQRGGAEMPSVMQRMKQHPLITNYFPVVSNTDKSQRLITNYLGNKPTTVGEALDNPAHPLIRSTFKPWNHIEITIDGGDVEATFQGIKVGTLTLYFDSNDDPWINNVWTKDSLQGHGIGSAMVSKVTETHGVIYASSGTKYDEVDDFDTRHLSVEGMALVNSCIRKGIMQQAWLTAPRV